MQAKAVIYTYDFFVFLFFRWEISWLLRKVSSDSVKRNVWVYVVLLMYFEADLFGAGIGGI